MKKTIGALVVALAFIVGCSGDEGTAPPSAGQGRLRIYLTDAPAAYEAVNIAVVRVEVIRSENDTAGGRFIINNTPAVYDLLQLRNGAQVVLGDTMLPPGQYEQIRLIIGDGSNVLVDGTMHPLEVPSGPQTGVKLNHTITILPDALYELTLDFDAARSIVVTGNGRYKLKPVIRMQASQISGNKLVMVRRHLAMLQKYRLRSGEALGPWAYVYTLTHFVLSIYLRLIRRTL